MAKHKMLKDFQLLTPDKKIFILKTGTILENYVYKTKTDSIEVDRDIIENNPDYFSIIDWKSELLTYIRSNKLPQPAQLSKKLIPFIEEMFVIGNANKEENTPSDNNIEEEYKSKLESIREKEEELKDREFELSKIEKKFEEKSRELEESFEDKRQLLITKKKELDRKESEISKDYSKIEKVEEMMESARTGMKQAERLKDEYQDKIKSIREAIDQFNVDNGDFNTRGSKLENLLRSIR